MRRFFSLILTVCLVLLSGCTKENVLPQITGPEGDSFAGLTVYLSETVLYDEMKQSQKLSDPNTPEGAYFLSRLNEIVKRMGFKITFETIPNLWPQATPDPEGRKYAYIKSAMEYAAKLRAGDAAVVFSDRGELAGYLAYLTEGSQPYVRQISREAWQQFAPQWYALNEYFLADDLSFVPTGYYADLPDNPVLLVRDEIAQAYGQPINTFDEYEAFLRWCAQRYPDDTPSIITDNIVYPTQSRNIQHELLTLIAPDLDGYPIDKSIRAQHGFTLAYTEDEGVFFRPVEQDPGFAAGVKRLLTLRDEGLIDIVNLEDDITKSYDDYSSALVTSWYWYEYNLPYILSRYSESLYPFLSQTPYILYSGIQPDLRPSYPSTYSISCLGVNASDEAVAEWLSFLEFLHTSAQNLRGILWGEDGVEYTLENGLYKPLPYPKPEELDRPDQYDFRYDFRALLYFADDRYPRICSWEIGNIKIVKSVDTSKLQRALDALIIPEIPETKILKTIFEPTLYRRMVDGPGNISKAYSRREEAFAPFIKALFAAPVNEVETMIEEFARDQQAYCQTLIGFYTEQYKLGDRQEEMRALHEQANE